MRSFINRIGELNRRIDAALGRRLGWLERWSARLGSPAAALAVSLAWAIPIAAVKIVLLRNFIQTSDIAYYENMLYNTGPDLSAKTFHFLYAYRDVIYFHSRTFLTEHFSPTFGLLAPFYQLFHGPLFLVLLQPFLIAVAGLGIYRLGRLLMAKKGISPVFGLAPLLFQIVCLFNYSNVSATIDTIYGFHHDSLIPPLIAWLLVCVLEARWKIAALLFVLLLGMKENLPIIFSASCAYCFVFNGMVPRKKAALGVLACLLFFAFCYLFEFRTHNRHVALLYQFGNSENIYAALDRLGDWQLLGYFLPAILAPALALPALGELSMELMGKTVELDWHGFPLMELGVIGTLFTGIMILGLTWHSRIVGGASMPRLHRICRRTARFGRMQILRPHRGGGFPVDAPCRCQGPQIDIRLHSPKRPARHHVRPADLLRQSPFPHLARDWRLCGLHPGEPAAGGQEAGAHAQF